MKNGSRWSFPKALHDLEEKFHSGSEKGVFWKRGLFRRSISRDSREFRLKLVEILENPQAVEKN